MHKFHTRAPRDEPDEPERSKHLQYGDVGRKHPIVMQRWDHVRCERREPAYHDDKVELIPPIMNVRALLAREAEGTNLEEELAQEEPWPQVEVHRD